MAERAPRPGDVALVDRAGLDRLLARLGDGRRLIGPTERDGAIVLDDIDALDDLPAGRGDEQSPGRYRLVDRDDGALWAHAVGPHSAKGTLFPSRALVLSARRDGDGFEVAPPQPPEPTAVVGLRPCDLRAAAVQDRVLLSPDHPDRDYGERRTATMVVAAQCTDPASTCFCTSMGGHPRAADGFDLALTELGDGTGRLVVEVGTDAGAAAMADVPHRSATPEDVAAAHARTDDAAARIDRRVDADAVPSLLASTLEHPRWDDVAERCLTCANCTMVCPTCFCHAVEDTTDLTGEHAERWRRWESCFTLEHSHLSGGPSRESARSRYRQWLTHKFGTWWDQFGESGCVGCGRCITWCPVGIDVTEELAALAEES